ncbi:MAG TPA: hypothetical protein PLI22_03555 [Caldisericia bacterium]|nr:hypothetical protein [Caldisericia bacterium]
MSLIYINIGNTPDYLNTSFSQSTKYASSVQLISGELSNNYLSRNENNKIFNQISFLNKYGLGNFWSVTLQRLFILEQYMLENNKFNIFHIENDVLIYENPEIFVDNFKKIYRDKLIINPLTNHLSTAAYIFIPSYKSIKRVNDKLIEYLSLGEQKLIELTGEEMINEMVLLKLIERTTDFIDYLPAFPSDKVDYNFYYEVFGYYFDPASWGQFLDGTPNHPPGFVDKRHYIGQEIMKNGYKIDFIKGRPYIIDDKYKMKYKLANLHIHSKNLHKFV